MYLQGDRVYAILTANEMEIYISEIESSGKFSREKLMNGSGISNIFFLYRVLKVFV